jgi:peptidoglycan/LPS O-acetylase OafA/YrhL
VPAIVGAIHSAFSIATASTFAMGIATSLLAAALVLLFREAPATASEREWVPRDSEPGEPSASAA